MSYDRRKNVRGRQHGRCNTGGVGGAATGVWVEVMTRIATLSDDELRARRAQIVEALRARGISLNDLRNRAVHYSLIGDEHDLWEQLSSIAFLLGETSA